MKFRVKDNEDPYAVVAEMVQQMVDKIFNIQKEYVGDLIVRMGTKQDSDTKYYYNNELLYFSEYGTYNEWRNDWFEGNRCIDLIGFTPVDCIETKYCLDHIESQDLNIIIRKSTIVNTFKMLEGIDDVLAVFQDEVEYERKI